MTSLLPLLFGVPILATSFSERVREVRQAMEQAQMRAGLSDKTCAALTELDQSHWTKQRTLGGIVGRLVALPKEFWVEFLPSLSQIVGVPIRIDTDDDRLERVVRRALKAELHAKQESGDSTCDDESSAA